MLTADLVVNDREDEPLLVVEMKTDLAGPEAESQLAQYLGSIRRSTGEPAPFGMLVDPESIRLYRTDPEGPPELVETLPSREVFQHYDPEFEGAATPYETRKVFHWYLTGLARGWLEDLIEPWKAGVPPRSQGLADLGLLPRLERATLAEEVRLRAHPLR